MRGRRYPGCKGGKEKPPTVAVAGIVGRGVRQRVAVRAQLGELLGARERGQAVAVHVAFKSKF
jgi:hypothetical protein